MKKSKKTILMASDDIALPVLSWLNDNYNLQLVITSSPAYAGRGRKKLSKSPIHKKSEKLNLKILTPKKIGNKTIRQINKIKPDFILVFAYGKIIPLSNIKQEKVLNIHPSLLPKLRGPSPIRSAILRGYKKTGISLMKIDQKIDHGPVIKQVEIDIDKKETYKTLKDKVKIKSVDLLKKSLDKYLKDKLKAEKQGHSQATFTKIIKKEDGMIDFSRPSAQIERKIRAFNPWPGAYTKVNGKILKIYSAEVKNEKLKLREVQLEGRKRMSFKDFLNGWQKKLDFRDKII